MTPSTRHHLTLLDRTIMQLLNERARLISRNGKSANAAEAHVDDLLQRSAGPFPAGALRDAFAAIDRGCQEVTE